MKEILIDKNIINQTLVKLTGESIDFFQQESIGKLLTFIMKQSWWEEFIEIHGKKCYSGPSVPEYKIKPRKTFYLSEDLLNSERLSIEAFSFIAKKKIDECLLG